MKKLDPLRSVALVALVATTIGSQACSPDAKSPKSGDAVGIAEAVTKAFEAEAHKPAAEAFDAWSKVLESARDLRGTPLARAASLAALESLAGRDTYGVESIETGLADRIADGPEKLAALLDATLAEPDTDPIVRVVAARERLVLAAAAGDTDTVRKSRKATGCATSATIVGPFVGSPLTLLNDEGPVDHGVIAATYAPPGTVANSDLALGTSPVTTTGNGCTLDIMGTSRSTGLRYAVVDVEVKDAGRVHLGVSTAFASTVFVAGRKVLEVPYGELSGRTLRFAQVEVNAPSTLRVVVKMATQNASWTSIYALDDEGRPLATKAPGASSLPDSNLGKVVADGLLSPTSDAPAAVKFTYALGLAAIGDHKRAESTLAALASEKDAKLRPAISLAYARELLEARDLPSHRRQERTSAAYDATLAGWPDAWEAILGHAQILAAARRGGAGEIEAITDAKKRRDAGGASVDPLVDAYLALIGDGIYGTREEALLRVRPKLKGTRAGYTLDRATVHETEADTLLHACDPKRPYLGALACGYARLNVGDTKGALDEVARIRALWDVPREAFSLEVTATLKASGIAAIRPLYEAAPISERSTFLATMLAKEGVEGLAWLKHEIRVLEGDGKTFGDVVRARRSKGDATAGVAPSASYDERARKLISADRKSPAQPDVGTLILAREEKYELGEDGFVHAVVWDVRRLDGTADVESSAVARVAATNAGRGLMSKSIHRIFKADGTIVEPDAIAASQVGAELSQVEPGDYIELVAEGWFLPAADGALDLDTSDLMPARTGVEHALIELTAPTRLKFDLWSHPELGSGVPSESAGRTTTTWKLDRKTVRRNDKGQAALDAQVALRMGTWTWSRLARDAREGLLTEVERSPEVSAWVATAAGADRSATTALVGRLLKASKRAIPRVGILPLGSFGIAGMQSYNARTVLLDATGSRIALMHRALEELGVKSEVVWSEATPYSADPKMVARPWRFQHALLIAHVAEKVGDPLKPVWIDPDVDGYPPPPGHTSPELRGRFAITTKGEIVPVPANSEEEPDATTIDLTVDDTGRAKGTISILLRGREAQEVSMVLEEGAGEEREDALRSSILSWMPSADVTEVKASADGYQILLSAKVEVPHLLVPDGTRAAIAGLSPLRGGSLGASYTGTAKRTTALSIKASTDYKVHRVLRLPTGTAIATPLPAIDVTDKISKLHASRTAKVDGNTLVEDFALSLPTGVVPLESFSTFTAAARSVDDGFASVVRVTPPARVKIAFDEPKAVKKPVTPAKPKPR